MKRSDSATPSASRRRAMAIIAGLLGPGLPLLAASARKAQAQETVAPTCPDGYYFSKQRATCVRKPTCEADEFFSTTQEKCVTGGCFLTTACVDELGLADDCYELSTLRGFRDGPLSRGERGRALVELYYELAPLVLRRLPDAHRSDVLNALYARYIVPSVIATRLGMHGVARQIYATGTLRLIRGFAPEQLEARREQLIALFGDRARRMLG